MNNYKYEAVNEQQQPVRGVVKAKNKHDAEEHLKNMHLNPHKLELKPSFFAFLNAGITLGGITAWEKSTFYQKLGTMLQAGVPLLRALDIISQIPNPKVRGIVLSVRGEVSRGRVLSDSAAQHPNMFNPIDISMIKAGEATGNLDKILFRLAEAKEKESNLRKKLQSAMVYPIMVVLVIVGVIVIMIRSVIPVIADLYKEAKADLPYTTKVMIAVSNFIQNNYAWIAIVLTIFIILFIIFAKKTTLGALLWGLIKLRTPIFGSIHQNIALTDISSCLALLISSGVPIVKAVKMTSRVADSRIYRRSFDTVADQLEKGVPISASLETFPTLYPSILVNMVSAGEESGTTDQMLVSLAHYYENEADTKIKSLSSALEPIIIVLLGIGVAFVVLAVMSPIYNLSNVDY